MSSLGTAVQRSRARRGITVNTSGARAQDEKSHMVLSSPSWGHVWDLRSKKIIIFFFKFQDDLINQDTFLMTKPYTHETKQAPFRGGTTPTTTTTTVHFVVTWISVNMEIFHVPQPCTRNPPSSHPPQSIGAEPEPSSPSSPSCTLRHVIRSSTGPGYLLDLDCPSDHLEKGTRLFGQLCESYPLSAR